MWHVYKENKVQVHSPNAFIKLLECIRDGVSEMENKGVILQGQSVCNPKFVDALDLIDKNTDTCRGCWISFVLIGRDMECPSMRLKQSH